MVTQIFFKIDDYNIEVELDPASEFCSAIKIVDLDTWFIFEFNLRDIPADKYAEEVVWDYSRQEPKHTSVINYDPFVEGFEYCEEEVKAFIIEQPSEKWKQLEL